MAGKGNRGQGPNQGLVFWEKSYTSGLKFQQPKITSKKRLELMITSYEQRKTISAVGPTQETS